MIRWLFLAWLFVSVPGWSHPLDDASLEIWPSPTQMQVQWTVPPSVTTESLTLAGQPLEVSRRTPLPSGHTRLEGTIATGEVAFDYQAWPRSSRDVPRCILVVHGPDGAVSAVLTPEQNHFALQKPWAERAFSFFQLGMEHIFTGFDHLLFLLTLLLPGGEWRTYLKTVTAFTLAHSLTLSLSVLGIVSLPSQPVEVAIALSIAISALWNLRSRSSGRRWPLALGFGLIHGLGFAGALQERGVAGHDAALPLVSFNFGVEVGQVIVVLLALPVLWRLRDRRSVRIGISLGTIAVALFWSWQRW